MLRVVSCSEVDERERIEIISRRMPWFRQFIAVAEWKFEIFDWLVTNLAVFKK